MMGQREGKGLNSECSFVKSNAKPSKRRSLSNSLRLARRLPVVGRHRRIQGVQELDRPGDHSFAPAERVRHIKEGKYSYRTLLYLRISRTRVVNASSTLIRCLADVSMNLQLKCFARSRPSVEVVQSIQAHSRILLHHLPFIPTCLSYSKSHLLATTMTGKVSLSFTRRICW